MKTPVRSDAEARKLSTPPRTGWRTVKITDAVETPDKNGQEMTVLTFDADGLTLRDWLTAHDRGALKVRRALEAVSALAKWEATGEFTPDDFIGHEVQVKVVADKRRGWLNVEDYRAVAPARVVNLRSAG